MIINYIKNNRRGKCTISNAKGSAGAGDSLHHIPRAGVSVRYHFETQRDRTDSSGRHFISFTDPAQKFRLLRLHLAGIIFRTTSQVLCTYRERERILPVTHRIMEPASSIR